MKNSPANQRVPLTPERIYRAALELIQRTSIDELSMRKLAAELGVDAMSIYHHVANKQALLIGVYQTVLEELELPSAPDLSWQDSLRAVARNFYRLARRYPKIIPHLFTSPYGTPRDFAIYQFLRDTIARTGLDSADQIRATAAMYTYAIGISNVASTGLRLRPLYRPEHGPAVQAAGRGYTDSEEDLALIVDMLIAGIEQLTLRRRQR